jgi:hypothetical protein
VSPLNRVSITRAFGIAATPADRNAGAVFESPLGLFDFAHLRHVLECMSGMQLMLVLPNTLASAVFFHWGRDADQNVNHFFFVTKSRSRALSASERSFLFPTGG